MVMFQFFHPTKIHQNTIKILFDIVQAHLKVPTLTGVEELWKIFFLQWKLMDLGGIPSKIDEYFHWGPIFYVCSSARNLIVSM